MEIRTLIRGPRPRIRAYLPVVLLFLLLGPRARSDPGALTLKFQEPPAVLEFSSRSESSIQGLLWGCAVFPQKAPLANTRPKDSKVTVKANWDRSRIHFDDERTSLTVPVEAPAMEKMYRNRNGEMVRTTLPIWSNPAVVYGPLPTLIALSEAGRRGKDVECEIHPYEIYLCRGPDRDRIMVWSVSQPKSIKAESGISFKCSFEIPNHGVYIQPEP